MLESKTLTEQYYDNLRKKIVFHIRGISGLSSGDGITPQAFHAHLLPKFPGTSREHVIRLFWEMTHIDTSHHFVYHILNEEWLNYDRKI